jgi:hypothetical protein
VLPTRSDAVMELGKRLVAELKVGDDLLGSWMAHHVARQMQLAQVAPSSEKGALEENCARQILELWRYRDSLPRQPKPLQDLQPILQTLVSLDVDQPGFRYAREALRAAALESTEGETKQWLDLAFGVDYTARLLIGFALRVAALGAAPNVAPWVKLAEDAGASEDVLPAVVRFLLNSDAKLRGEESETAALRDKLRRLEEFTRLATMLADDLRKQIESQVSESGPDER